MYFRTAEGKEKGKRKYFFDMMSILPGRMQMN